VPGRFCPLRIGRVVHGCRITPETTKHTKNTKRDLTGESRGN
jgi:hypothetical protein